MVDSNPQGEGGRVARLLREQLNEMMAASQGLEGVLSDSAAGRGYLSVLNRGLCRQLRLARHLELEQRLNSEDEVRLTIHPVDLVPVCRGLTRRVEGLARFLDIQMSFSTDLTTLTTLADQAALEEMLLCLISNSFKSIGRDGDVELALEQRGRKAVFTLKDNGGGMNAETLAALFDPQEEDPEEGSGTGLGLPLAQQIAALHGGILIVDSQEHKGVRLAVSLPLRDPERSGSLCSSRPALDETGGWDKVLVELSDCLPTQAFLPEELG